MLYFLFILVLTIPAVHSGERGNLIWAVLVVLVVLAVPSTAMLFLTKTAAPVLLKMVALPMDPF